MNDYVDVLQSKLYVYIDETSLQNLFFMSICIRWLWMNTHTLNMPAVSGLRTMTFHKKTTVDFAKLLYTHGVMLIFSLP